MQGERRLWLSDAAIFDANYLPDPWFGPCPTRKQNNDFAGKPGDSITSP